LSLSPNNLTFGLVHLELKQIFSVLVERRRRRKQFSPILKLLKTYSSIDWTCNFRKRKTFILFRKRKQSFNFGSFCWQLGKGRVDKYFTCVKFGDDKEREYSGVFQ